MSQAVISQNPKPAVIDKDPVVGYFQRSELPLASLMFVLPLIVLYELGTRFIVPAPPTGGETRIIAFTLMRLFFNLFGATGQYLPCLAVVGILLTWHIARNDAWHFKFSTMIGMLMESMVLALPVLALSYAVTRYIPPLAAPTADPLSMLVLSIGAGVYEELVFRLAAFTGLNLLLIDAIGLKKTIGYPLMVGLSAVLFSSYHYLGSEPFHIQTFIFRTAAGLYFGAVFVLRGFGVTAGCHAFYDILVVLLPVITWVKG
jgi:hypothetical protein